MAMIKKAGNLFATAYLLIMFCIYPLYMEEGYANIGEVKNHFFLCVSFAAFLLLALTAVCCLTVKMKEVIWHKRAYLIDWEKVSITDLFVLLYATEVFLSYVFTDYRQEALWGTEGWYIGCIPLILLCGLYFLLSRFWNGNSKILYGAMAVSGIVFVLGICNRFSFYPIVAGSSQPDFIATLGNINWYCGYLSVIAPVGICQFVLEKETEKRSGKESFKRWIFGIYTVIAFMAGFSQGSSSIFLWFGALFFALLWIAAENRKWVQNWCLLVVLWGASAQLVRILRHVFWGRYNYDTDTLCGYLTDSSVTLWIVFAGLVVYYICVQKNKKISSEKEKELKTAVRKWAAVFAFVLLGIWLLLSVVNTKWGLSVLKENAFFLFNKDWGNGRGTALFAGVKIFEELPFWHKLLGAGPDCFSKYAYAIPETAALLRESFGSARLTNAHCELLTGLVNTGILGTCFFVGIFVSFVMKSMKKGKHDGIVSIFGVCAFCYLIHNMVSFAQVLNLPFVFLLLGMGARKFL